MPFEKINSKSSHGNRGKSSRRGSNDVWYSILKGCVVVFIIFAVSFFLMKDLKISEGKKITQAFLQAAQENIRILEATGDTINNYLVANNGKLERKDAVFIWDMVSKTHLADMLMWYTAEDNKWRHMSAGSLEYQIIDYQVGKDTPELRRFLRRISEFPKNKSLLTKEQLDKAFSSVWMRAMKKKDGRIPWLFARNQGKSEYDFLILSSDIQELFSLDTNDSDLFLHKITLRAPYNNEALFSYNYQENQDSGSFFKPLDLKYGVMMAGESWSVEMKVSPTVAYIIFTTLPWIILIIGLGFVVAIAIYLHRHYRNESQLAHISETLADKNTELLGWEAEKKKMLKEFRKSEWEYRAIINAVSDIIFEVDKDGKFLFLNETWEHLTGKKQEKISGSSLFDYLHPKDKKYHQEMFQEFISGYKGAYRREVRFKMYDDSYRFVELAFSMMRLSNNEPRVVGTITDIEKRKQAELAHSSAEKKYKDMFKNALNGIYQASPDGRFINVNQAFADIVGYDSPEVLMANISDIKGQIYIESGQRSLLEMQVTQQGMVIEIESEIYKKDGSNIWILENMRAVYDENSEVSYFEGTVWDVTKRREIDQALRTAKLEADLTSRARIEFMANMSHELRTPLNAVIGFSEIIRSEVMGPIEQDAYKEYANDIHDSGKQLLSIINDILELSQIEIGERELKESEFPLLRVVQSVLDLLQHKIKQARLEIILDVSKDLPRIFAEELAFKQIFMNVLGNAIKFTPEDGTVTLSASLDSDNNMIIEVTDTGIGMTDKELEKALEPFGQVATEMDRGNSGTGLGLSIIQSLVELHQGRFMMASKKDIGTTIKLVFPKERMMIRTAPEQIETVN